MSKSVRSVASVLAFLLFATMTGSAAAEEAGAGESARTLNKQEVINLISGKKIVYRTSKATSASDVSQGSMEVNFTRTEESGGTLTAYTNGYGSSSSDGKWHVNDDARLVRQYDKVKWGTKPFQCSIVMKGGKYFVRFGAADDHEIVTIE